MGRGKKKSKSNQLKPKRSNADIAVLGVKITSAAAVFAALITTIGNPISNFWTERLKTSEANEKLRVEVNSRILERGTYAMEIEKQIRSFSTSDAATQSSSILPLMDELDIKTLKKYIHWALKDLRTLKASAEKFVEVNKTLNDKAFPLFSKIINLPIITDSLILEGENLLKNELTPETVCDFLSRWEGSISEVIFVRNRLPLGCRRLLTGEKVSPVLEDMSKLPQWEHMFLFPNLKQKHP